MISRHFAAAFALTAAIVYAGGTQAQYSSDGRYLDPNDPDVQEACRGLEAQSRMSLTSNVPDDIDNGDPSGEYQLSQLPFNVWDCRRAGIR